MQPPTNAVTPVAAGSPVASRRGANQATDEQPGVRARWWRRWPAWAGYAAALWSLAYGMLGVFWALGGAGFPFGRDNDPNAAVSILEGAHAATVAPVIAALGLGGAAVAWTLARSRGRGTLGRAGLGVAWALAVTLTLLLPDYRVLMAVGYAPIMLVGAPFGWPPGVTWGDMMPWPVVNQVLCIAGGLLWAGTAVASQRRTRDACGRCGRTAAGAAWLAPAAAARWGRWAVGVAVAVPVLYAVTRWAWALGIPLGVSEEFIRDGVEDGFLLAGAGLATLGIGGAVLTLGLVQRWGEVFPRWMVGLAGRRVPPALAVVPASVVSVLVTTAGLMYIRLQLSGAFEGNSWTTVGPELLWPVWGAALAAATLAYATRRRGRCTHCGRA